MTTTSIKITVTVGEGVTITLVRFSILAFDVSSIQANGMYQVYSSTPSNNAGADATISFAAGIVPNIFIGLRDFTTSSGSCGF
jgi:hypothetical protein